MESTATRPSTAESEMPLQVSTSVPGLVASTTDSSIVSDFPMSRTPQLNKQTGPLLLPKASTNINHLTDPARMFPGH